MRTITQFTGGFRFLSNFYPAPIRMKGEVYATAEHAYQAAKTVDDAEREWIRQCDTPGQAKRAGKKVTLRDGWQEMQDEVMLRIVRQKFSKHDPLRKLLLGTGNAVLQEGNTWGDRYWGCVLTDEGWEGQNKLGEILMQVRSELLDQFRSKASLLVDWPPEKEPSISVYSKDKIGLGEDGEFVGLRGFDAEGPDKRFSDSRGNVMPIDNRMEAEIWVLMSPYDDTLIGEYQSRDEAESHAGLLPHSCVISCYTRRDGIQLEDFTYAPTSEAKDYRLDPGKRLDRGSPFKNQSAKDRDFDTNVPLEELAKYMEALSHKPGAS